MKKALFAAACTLLCCIGNEMPANAVPGRANYHGRVCTKHYDGWVHVRSAPDKRAKSIGRKNNDAYVAYSGGFHRDRFGYTWYQTSWGGWIRGDLLCTY